MFLFIKDYILVTSENTADAFQYMSNLLVDLGLPMNLDNGKPPAKAITCLGVNIDIVANTLSTGQDNMVTLHTECMQIRYKRYVTKRGFQSLYY